MKFKRTKAQKGNRLVEVEWWDSTSSGGWHSPAETREFLGEPCECCVSVGYLLEENKRFITLSQSISSHGNQADIIKIPQFVVHKVRVLKR